MINTILQRAEKMAPKALPFYKHVCYIVKGKKICAEEVNQYGGDNNSHHAEECAIKRCFSKRREKEERVLRGQGPLRI